MELSDVSDMLNHMRDMVELALGKLDDGVRQTQENEGKVYWMNMKIQNNSQKFTKEEIDKAGKLEAELRNVSQCYKRMSGMAKEILQEIDTYIEETKKLENLNVADWEAKLGGNMKISQLNEKIGICLGESKRCLEMQGEILADEKVFEDSLKTRCGSSKGVWFIKLKSLLKGVHMKE